MTLPLPLRFKGAPGSPYTRKMLALLRYRHLPYELLIGDWAAQESLPEPKVSLLPTFYLPNASGEIEAVVDSTPLIRRLEAEFQQRSVIPTHPVVAFLNYLLEDYADEWLTKAMFHYRWHYPADIDRAGTILPMWTAITMPPEQLAARKRVVAERQIARLYVVGSNETTAPVIEASYRRFLAIFDRVLQSRPFLFGHRPSSADFAVYAQLTQLARFDPTPAGICLESAPRVFAWVDLVDDLSGNPATADAWMASTSAAGLLGELLGEVGRVYVPALLANALALQRGDKQMTTVIDGKPWTQPAFPYQGKCLQWIREEFAALSPRHQDAVREILDGSACERLIEVPGV